MKKQHIRTAPGLAVFLLSTLFSHTLFAEDPLDLEHVLVTARLQPIAIGDIGSSVTVITGEEIKQKQVKYLSEHHRQYCSGVRCRRGFQTAFFRTMD